MKKSRIYKIVLAVTGGILLFAAIVMVIIISLKRNNHSAFNGAAVTMEYALQEVLSGKLMTEDIVEHVGDTDEIHVAAAYYDGIRLYVSLESDQMVSVDMLMFDNTEGSWTANLLIDAEEASKVTGKTESADIVIFNYICSDDSNGKLIWNGKTIAEIVLGSPAPGDRVDIMLEECLLETVVFGKTSTLVECTINALIEGASFQYQFGGEVCSVYILEEEDHHYTLLIPCPVDKTDRGYLISNTSNGNVELRIPMQYDEGWYEM